MSLDEAKAALDRVINGEIPHPLDAAIETAKIVKEILTSFEIQPNQPDTDPDPGPSPTDEDGNPLEPQPTEEENVPTEGE